MKDLKKQLMAAIAMTLVAAIALGSSTYAWFAASGSASATGVDVVAQAESAMSISKDGYDTGFGSTAVMVTERALGKVGSEYVNYTPVELKTNTGHTAATPSQGSDMMMPAGDVNAETKDVDDQLFHKLDADSLARVDSTGKVVNTPSQTTTFTDTTEGYFRDVVWLRALKGSNTAGSTMSVKVNVKITEKGWTEDIVKALRVAVVGPNGKVIGACSGSELTTSTGDPETLGVNVGTFDIQYGDEAAKIKANKVAVYVWIEGNDDNCKNGNAMSATSSSHIPVAVTFSKAD